MSKIYQFLTGCYGHHKDIESQQFLIFVCQNFTNFLTGCNGHHKDTESQQFVIFDQKAGKICQIFTNFMTGCYGHHRDIQSQQFLIFYQKLKNLSKIYQFLDWLLWPPQEHEWPSHPPAALWPRCHPAVQ